MHKTIVFVYGTLLRGMQRASVLSESRFLGLGEMQGDLYNLGHYPALIEGKGCVIGELYEVDAATLKQLDGIEGFKEGAPEQLSLYLRVQRKATFWNDGHSEMVSVYLYNGQVDPSRRIKHGDYRQLMELHENNETYYIAYGSNLDQSRLEVRVEGKVEVMVRGHLHGFELAFNKRNLDGSSCANVKVGQSGNGLPFVAYRLPEGIGQIELLDIHEGNPNTYRRIAYPFPYGNSGDSKLGFMYVAGPHLIREGLKPRDEYLEHILQGYEMHGFAWPEAG